MALELVTRIPGDVSPRGDQYVLNHERMFAMVDQIRTLSKLRPVTGPEATPHATMDQESAREARLPPPPRLLVAYGRDEGLAFPLAGPLGSRWRVGRGPGCEIRLDYDPFSSAHNSTVERTSEGFRIHDQLPNRNGTWVNWSRLPPGSSLTLAAGDLVTVGRTVLAFQA